MILQIVCQTNHALLIVIDTSVSVVDIYVKHKPELVTILLYQMTDIPNVFIYYIIVHCSWRDVIKFKCLPYRKSFARGIIRWPMVSPQIGFEVTLMLGWTQTAEQEIALLVIWDNVTLMWCHCKCLTKILTTIIHTTTWVEQIILNCKQLTVN